MNDLKMSISGVRGLLNQSFNSNFVVELTLAFVQFLNSENYKGKKVVIGNDSRPSHKAFEPLIIDALKKYGFDVYNIGTAPTPSVLFTVRDLQAAGAIIITASHNPIEWNGLKFVNHFGEFINPEQWQKLHNFYKDKVLPGSSAREGKLYKNNDSLKKHIQKVLTLVDVEKIKKANLKVAFDACNGAGSIITESFLKELNCDIISIYNNQEDESFGRKPEPLAENLLDLEKLVRDNQCDIGFALDPDADRLAIVSEKGKAIGEEYTLAIAIDQFLSHKKTDIAVNISTSRMVDDVARKHGIQVYRSKVGEINVLEMMKEKKCDIGGEGNGGVIIPEVNHCRDSLVSMIMALSAMVEKKKTITEITFEIPVYSFIKDKVSVEGISLKDFYSALLEKYNLEKINQIDGIRIDLEDGWFQIRESNTEPIIRIFAESTSEKKSKGIIEDIKNWIHDYKL